MSNNKSLKIKQSLLDQLCSQMKENVQSRINAFETARQDAIEAEGRMQSRYDSMKEESGNLGTSLSYRVLEARQVVSQLESFRFSGLTRNGVSGQITLGSLIELEDSKKNKYFYFILPAGGGEQIKSKYFDQEILVVTPAAPFFHIFQGKTIGDSAVVGPRKLTVVSVF